MLIAIQIFLGIVLFVLGVKWAITDSNKDVAAWRQGKKGKAALWFIWDILRVFLFFAFAPVILIILIFRN